MDEMKQIVHLMINRTMREVEGQGYKMNTTDEAKEKIAEEGFDPQYGARPLRRAIQKMIEDPLAEEFIRNNPEPGSVINIAWDKDKGEKGELTFDITPPEKTEVKKEEEKAEVAAPKAKAEDKKKEEKVESSES